MSQLLVLAGPHTPTLRAAAQQLLQDKAVEPSRALVLGYGRDLSALWGAEVRTNEDDPAEPNATVAPIVSEPEAFFEAALQRSPAAPRLLRSPDRLFLLRELLLNLRGQLGPLRALSGTSELLRQLDLLISDARRSDVAQLPPGGDWGADLALVWESYNGRLHELHALDVESAPLWWAAHRDEVSPSLAQTCPYDAVVFDNVLTPAPALWAGLVALTTCASQVVVTLPVPGRRSAPTAFKAWPDAFEKTLAAATARQWRDWASAHKRRITARWLPHPVTEADAANSPAGLQEARLKEARLLLGCPLEELELAMSKSRAVDASKPTVSQSSKPHPAEPVAASLPQMSLFGELLESSPQESPQDADGEAEAGREAEVSSEVSPLQTAGESGLEGDAIPPNGTVGADETVVGVPQGLTLNAAPTPRDELRRIAGDIRRRLNEGAALCDFAVLLPDPARYAGTLEAAFAEHDLPLYIKRARPHSSYPAVRRALAILQLATAPKVRLDVVNDTFGDGLFALADDEGNAFDARAFTKACRQMRREEFEDGAWIELENGYSEVCAPLSQLRAAGAALMSSRALAKVPARVGELLEACAGHLRTSEDPLDGEAWRQVEAVLRALERVVGRHQEFGGKGRAAWLQWLTTELENTDAPLEAPVAGLEVSGLLPLESGLGAARVVYIGGLLEGEWPDTGLPGTLYARHARILEPLRAYRPDPSLRARHGLALALCEAEEVHLSYPQSRGGRETSRSPIVEDVLSLWPEVPSLHAPSAPVSRLAWLSTAGDQAAHLGRVETAPPMDSFATAPSSLRALNAMRRDRQDVEAIGVYGGALPPDPATRDALRTLLPIGGEVEQWKVSSLGQYAACPWKLWGRELLRLKPVVISRDDLPRSARGKLLHHIIEAFEVQWARTVTPERFREAWKALREVARDHIERLPLRRILRDAEACALLGRDWASEGETASGVLGKWLRSRCAPDDLPPAGFMAKTEKPKKGGFGDWARPTVPLGGSGHVLSEYFGGGAAWDWMVQLDEDGQRWAVGRVDRLEIAPRGELLVLLDEQDKGAWLLPGFAEASAGLDFGLPLALLAARDKLQEALDLEPVTEMPDAPKLAAANFSLPEAKASGRFGERGTLGRNPRKSGSRAQVTRGLPHETEAGEEAWWHWLDGTRARATQVVELIGRGQFPASLHEAEVAGCPRCDYRAACRRDENLSTRRRQAMQGDRNVFLPPPLVLLEESEE